MTVRITTNRGGRVLRGPVRATIAQVAAAAGVATATVSGILNNRADCYASDATRQRVRDAADKLGYRPNPLARGLAGKSTATLGVVGAAFDVEPTARAFGGFEVAAQQAGNLIITAPTYNKPDLEDQAIRFMLDRCVDGLMVLPTESGSHKELKQLVARGFPVVTFTGVGRLPFATADVSTDNYAGGVLLGKHLIAIGRVRAFVINNAHTCYVNEQKMAGVDAAFAAAGLAPPRRMNLPMAAYSERKWNIDEFVHVRQFIESHRGRFDALIGVGDLLAMSGIRVCTELGLRVPEDVAVVGYDNCAFASQTAVPLTSVEHDMELAGAQVFALLQQQLSGASGAEALPAVKIAPQLRVRKSTTT